MSTRNLLFICACAAVLLTVQTSAANETGFELNVGGISTHMDGTFAGPASADLTSVSDRNTGWALSGTWYFSPSWGIDLEYADHGNFRGFNLCPPDFLCIAANSPEIVEVKSLTLSLLGEMPLGGQWSAFGRVGYADTDLNRRFAGDTDDQGWVAGVGLRRMFGQNYHLALEYRTEAADLDRYGVSFGYRF